MKRKQFYVVDIPNSDCKVLIFRVANFTHSGARDDDTYDFYLSDGLRMIFQFGIPCNVVRVSEFEDLAISNFNSGNMCF